MLTLHIHSYLATKTFPMQRVEFRINMCVHKLSMAGFPALRWHQTADTGAVPNPSLPRVFMAVTHFSFLDAIFNWLLPFISRLEHKRGYLLGICAAYGRLTPSACRARIRPSSPKSQKCFRQKFFDFQIRKQSRCPSTPTTRNHTPPTLWWGFTPGTSRWSWSNPILHLRHQRLSWFNPNLHKQIFLV